MRSLITLLLLANIAAATELPLADTPIGPAPGYRTAVAAASNGRGFLVVSREQRYSAPLCGMRADDRGRPLDPVMFPITDYAYDLAGVASDGDSYLVAWFAATSVRFSRVDDQAKVTPGGELANAAIVSLVWGGSAYVAGYVDPSDHSANVAVIASDGTVLRSRIPIVTGLSYPSTMRVSPGAPGTVIVTWSGRDSHLHAVVAHTSALRDGSWLAPVADEPAGFPVFSIVSPAVAANGGGQTLVIWVESNYPVQPSGGVVDTKIRARRLDANGTPLGDVFTVAQLYHDSWENMRPTVVWNGSAFIVGYSHMSDLGGSVISVASDNHVTTLHEFTNADPGNFPLLALAGSDRGALFVWNHEQLNGAFVDSAFGATQLFSPASASQSNPSIAWCGDAYRAVWVEDRGGKRIMTGRVSVNGVPLDGRGTPLIASSGSQGLPKIACSASNALVAWSEYDVQTSVVTQHAVLVDPDGTPHIPIGLGPSSSGGPAIAWNGSEYLVAWTQAQNIALVRITRDGQLIDFVPQLVPAEHATGVSIAWNGSEYLLAWGDTQINALRLAPSLTAIGSKRTVSGSGAYSPVAIAGNGEWLVAWTDFSNGAFVRLDGSLADLERGSIAGKPSDGAFIGNAFRVVTDDSAISHGVALAAVVHSRVTSELSTRLYVSIDSGRVRASRR